MQTIEQAEALAQQGKYVEVLSLLDTEALDEAAEPRALYVRAVCLRSLDRRGEALEVLQALLASSPDHVRAYQELGHVHVAGRNSDKAIAGYVEAVKRDPALLSSWRPLVMLYRMVGDVRNQQIAEARVTELEQMPEALLAVRSYLNQGNLESADKVCRHFLSKNKQHVEALRLLAEIADRAKIIDDAEFFLDSAVAFEPKHVGARFDLVNILLKRQKFAMADQYASALSEEHPENLEFKLLTGATRLGVGDTRGAIRIYRELIEAGHNRKNALLLLGHAEKTAGNIEASVAAYQQLYAQFPDFGDAFWSLANTKTYRFTDAELAHMRDYEQRSSTTETDRVHFCFALGKALEDLGEYESSFDFYERGNAINRRLLMYSAPDIKARAARQKTVCTSALFSEREGVGCDAPDPIFIVGLPRAGSTLLEQILASHSQIDGTLELPNVLNLARRLRGRAVPKEGEEPQYPAVLADLDLDYFQRFGQQFLDDTRVFRQEAPYFIDKMPNNFLHIGLIKLILPNAKIIDARRHPMSCCFSGFKQLFAEGQEFTYGLTEIGTYYKTYVELMDHWDEVLPGFVLRVQHEDVVADLESEVRRMLEFLHLPFEKSCLEFHKTERNVRTPSSEQVRQPIYNTQLEQWRHYETKLQPLIEALGQDLLQRYPITAT